MPIVYDPTSYLVSLLWESANFASGNGATVLGFNGGPATPESLEALSQNVAVAWTDNLRGVTDQDYTLGGVRVEGDVSSTEFNVNLPGTLNLTGPPSNCALIRYKKALGKGRRNGGRNFWPGLLAETSVDERGVVLPTTANNLDSALSQFITDIEEGTEGPWAEAIPQSVTDESVTPPILPWPEVISSGVRPVIGTQRRRVRP